MAMVSIRCVADIHGNLTRVGVRDALLTIALVNQVTGSLNGRFIV